MKSKQQSRMGTMRAFMLAMVMVFALGSAVQAVTTLDVYIRPNPGEEFIYDLLKQGFESANPSIKINYISVTFGEYFQKYAVMYAAGQAPDVFMPSTSWTVSYAMQDMVYPLDELAQQDKFNLNDIFPEVLNMYRVKGKLYGLPQGIASLAYLYNVNHFANSGISTPPLDWTVNDFLAIAKKLTQDRNGDGKIDRFATTATPYIFHLWSALGSNYFDDEQYPRKFLLNSPDGYAGLQLVQDMRWVHHIAPQTGEKADIYADTSSMMVIGHWNLAVVLKQAKFSWDLLSIPRVKQSVQRADGSAWSISKTSKHIPEAWAFVKFLGGYEGNFIQAKEQYITPAHRKVATAPEWRRIPNGPNISKEPFVYGLEHSYNNYVLTHPKGNDVMNIINPAINRVINNEATPKQALDAINQTVMDMIQQFK